MGLWSYDLDMATTRLYETMRDIGLNVRESIKPGQEIQLVYSNELSYSNEAGTRIHAATDLHESMLKTYKAILAMFHSFERKYFTVSSEEEAREAAEADDVERRQEARRLTHTYLPSMPNTLHEHEHEHDDLLTYRITSGAEPIAAGGAAAAWGAAAERAAGRGQVSLPVAGCFAGAGERR